MSRRAGWLLALLALLAPSSLPAQSVRAALERTTITADDSVLLSIDVEKPVGGATPDVGQLTRDFEILDSRREESVDWVRWRFELAPRHSGLIELPALAMGPGRATPVLTLQVLPAGDDPLDAFIEREVEPREPYVGQQVRYRERVFIGTPLRDLTIERMAPVTNALLRPLGGFQLYVAERDGRNYRVYERDYVVLPERSGELVLPPLQLRGRTSAGTGTDLNRGRLVERRSEPLRLQVKPRPADLDAAYWLPAPELELRVEWAEEPPALQVGEPATLVLTLTATGLDAAQLPVPEFPAPDWAEVYAEPPERETRNDGGRLHGRLRQRLVLVPTRAGAHELPALALDWWDTRADRARTARLPARTVTVADADGPGPATPDNPPPSATGTAPDPRPLSGHGLALSAALLLLWLLTGIGWWLDRRGRRPPRKAAARTEPSARRRLRTACRADDAPGAARALIDWAAGEWPRRPPTSLDALSRRLPEAAAAIRALERHLYAAPPASAWQGRDLWQALQSGTRTRRRQRKNGRTDPLPPLYPQSEEATWDD